MIKINTIDPEEASKFLRYDSQSGDLTWQSRPDNPSFNTRWAGKKAGCVAKCTSGKDYVQVRLKNKLYHAHRLGWVLAYGQIPDDKQIDHINGDGTDSRLENLRLVSATENKRNLRKPSTNTTGRVGVHKDKRRGTYYAKGWAENAPVHLGNYKTFEGAVKARERWELEQGFHANHGASRPL